MQGLACPLKVIFSIAQYNWWFVMVIGIIYGCLFGNVYQVNLLQEGQNETSRTTVWGHCAFSRYIKILESEAQGLLGVSRALPMFMCFGFPFVRIRGQR